VDQSPPPLGNSLLIVMSNTPGSLVIVRTVAQHLTDPLQTEITLAHYLEPVLWENGSTTIVQRLESLFQHEEGLLASTASTDHYFRQGHVIFRQAGIPPAHIHLEPTWNRPEVAAARVARLAAGLYSAVIIAQHHYDVIYRLLNVTLTEIVARHGSRAAVWIIDGYRI